MEKVLAILLIAIMAGACIGSYSLLTSAGKSIEMAAQQKQWREMQRLQQERDRHELEGLLVSTPVMLLNTQEKLKKGKLEEYLPQALEKRMDALQLKYELNLGSIEWQNLRDDISVAWEDFLSANSELMGKKLWQQLRNLLSQQGQLWSEQYKNNTLGPVFAEGIFFDMMAICEVDIRA